MSKISRYVAYYEQDGTLDARTAYQEMTDAEKNAQGIDLVRLRDSCDYKIDYPRIVQNAARYFA